VDAAVAARWNIKRAAVIHLLGQGYNHVLEGAEIIYDSCVMALVTNALQMLLTDKVE
jgi:hypothetical protein